MNTTELWLRSARELSEMRMRICSLAEKGSISGQDAYYLMTGEPAESTRL